MGLFRRQEAEVEVDLVRLQKDLDLALEKIKTLRKDLVKETTLRIRGDSKLIALIRKN